MEFDLPKKNGKSSRVTQRMAAGKERFPIACESEEQAAALTCKQPECRLIPFPMVNRIGRIRETAAKMFYKPTEKSAEHYRRQVDDAMTGQLSKIGLPLEAIETERAAFWNAVDAEMARQAYGWRHEPDGAA